MSPDERFLCIEVSPDERFNCIEVSPDERFHCIEVSPDERYLLCYIWTYIPIVLYMTLHTYCAIYGPTYLLCYIWPWMAAGEGSGLIRELVWTNIRPEAH